MRVFRCLGVAVAFSATFVSAATPQLRQHGPVSVPVLFEENRGQAQPDVRYFSRGRGASAYLFDDAVTLRFGDAKDSGTVRVTFPGGLPKPHVAGEHRVTAVTNYLDLSDASRNHTDIPNFRRARYSNLYRGIDLVFYGTAERQFEFDFVVQPGADPNAIRLAISGARALSVSEDGDLVIDTAAGVIRQHRPEVYQDVEGRPVMLAGNYRVDPRRREVSFEVGEYDRTRTLVIDPILAFSTLYGGSGDETPTGVAVDAAGNVYIGGTTTSRDLPLLAAYNNAANTRYPAVFVAKFKSSGSDLVYATYIATGVPFSTLRGPVVDDAGAAYFLKDGAELTKILPAGNGTAYSTTPSNYLVDPQLAVDREGNAIVAGEAAYAPTTVGAYRSPNLSGAAHISIAKFGPSGDRIWASVIGGNNAEDLTAVAVDTQGDVYFTGFAWSSDFPTTPGAMGPTTNRPSGTFAAKLKADGTALAYSTFLPLSVDRIAPGREGSLIMLGSGRPAFTPTAGAFMQAAGTYPYVLAALNPQGSAFQFATYLPQQATAMTVDTGGNIFLAGDGRIGAGQGFAYSPDAFQPYVPSPSYPVDPWIVALNPTGTAVPFATNFGTGNSTVSGLAGTADGGGAIYVVGRTAGTNFPTTSGAFARTLNGGYDVFLAKLVGGSESCTYSFVPARGTTSEIQITNPVAVATGVIELQTAPHCIWIAGTNTPADVTASPASGVGPATITYTVTARKSSTPKTVVLTIADQQFAITQPGWPCTYEVMPQSMLFEAIGGASSFNISTPDGCSWDATSSASWVTLNTSWTTFTSSGSLAYIVAPNLGEARTATVTIKGQTFTIQQAAAAPSTQCSYQAQPNTASLGSAGGLGAFAVTATRGCPWTATSTSDWLSINSPTGSGNGTISYIVGPNGGPARVGTISIGGESFTVSQANGYPAMYIFPRSVSLEANGNGKQSAQVQVTSNAPQTGLVVSTNHSWLTATLSSTSTPATLTITADPSGLPIGGGYLGEVTILGGSAVASVRVLLRVTNSTCFSTTVNNAAWILTATNVTGTHEISVTAPAACTFNGASTLFSRAYISGAPTAGAVPFAASLSYSDVPQSGAILVDGQLTNITAVPQQSRYYPYYYVPPDVPQGNPFLPYIIIVRTRGISSGCTTRGDYCPGDPVTREQMAAFVIRAIFGDQFPYPFAPYFHDVPQTNPFFKYIQKMREVGITAGCSATSYCPQTVVTRRQMARFLVTGDVGDVFPYRDTNAYYSDVPATDPFFKYVQKLKDLGITSGCSATAYCPDAPVTREQMAAFLVRTFLFE